MIHKTGRGYSKSRSRQASYVAPPTKTYSLATGALTATFGGGTIISDSETETISSGEQPATMRYLPNFCVHRKERYSIPQTGLKTSLWYTAASPTIRQETYSRGNDVAACLGAVKSKVYDTIGINTDISFLNVNGISLMTTNWSKLRPDLTELSVPNFLLDLKQLSGLFKLWRTAKSIGHNLAQGNLTLQYGWRPTISDAKRAVHAVLDLQQKLKAWNDRLGKLSRRQATVHTDTQSASGSFVYTYYTVKYHAVVQQKATAHLLYRPLPIQEMSNLERNLRGMLDSLGFQIDAGIIWDAIPFSFVIDWFLNIGDYVGQFSWDTLTLPFKMEASYLQFKETVDINFDVIENATSDHADINCGSGSYRRTLFHRMGAAPEYQSLVHSGWHFPSLNQAVLGLSLGLSRGR